MIDIPKILHPFNATGKNIESLTRKAIFDFSMLQEVNSLAIALSGGKDSLCLLYMLKAIIGKGTKNVKLCVIHIAENFSCRTSFEKDYLKNICKYLDVKLYFEKINLNLKNLDCYSCARERRKALFKIAKKNGIDTIAFGHHKDDNIQTLLLNLFHKAEFEGMMPKIKFEAYDISIIRPLIYVEEQEIIKFAKAYNILRQMYKCPIGKTSKRNDIKNIIEQIKLSFPHIKSNLSQSSFIYSTKKALKR